MTLTRRLQLVYCSTEDRWMATAIKVAFATTDMKHVNQHFGAAQAFAIYAVNRDRACFVEALEFGRLDTDCSAGGRKEPSLEGKPTPGGAPGPSSSELEASVSRRRSHSRAAGPLLNASGHHADKLVVKIGVLEGCVAVYSQAVGASAIKQLKAKGIQPMKVAPDTSIAQLLVSLHQELQQGPSHWLARAIADTLPADPERFDRMEAEGWSE